MEIAKVISQQYFPEKGRHNSHLDKKGWLRYNVTICHVMRAVASAYIWIEGVLSMKIIDAHLHLFPSTPGTDAMAEGVGHQNSTSHLRQVYCELDRKSVV